MARKKAMPWQEELAIVDRVMRDISGITDPNQLVAAYWRGISDLVSITDYLAVSRRGVEPPFYLVTRSSRFDERINPWTQRDKLPRMSGGVLGDIAYANRPVIIENLPGRLSRDDPAYFFLEGYEALVALPQYDQGEGLNVTMSLLPSGVTPDFEIMPMMHWQAGLFGRGTQNLVLRNQLGDALDRLDAELKAVGEIQRSLLPAELPAIPGFEIAAFYETSARAGGDYYDFFPLADDRWGLFIADVSGHGTPAAVLMAVTHAIAHSDPGKQTPPQDLLTHLNDHLVGSYARNGTFVTAFYAVLDPRARTLTYASAGHNPPRLARAGRVLGLDENAAVPLGIIAGQQYRQATVNLDRGDLLVLYTDGITESMAPVREGSRELFGVERLDRLLTDCSIAQAPAGCIEQIRAAADAFREHAPATDDQTLIALRCL